MNGGIKQSLQVVLAPKKWAAFHLRKSGLNNKKKKFKKKKNRVSGPGGGGGGPLAPPPSHRHLECYRNILGPPKWNYVWKGLQGPAPQAHGRGLSTLHGLRGGPRAGGFWLGCSNMLKGQGRENKKTKWLPASKGAEPGLWRKKKKKKGRRGIIRKVNKKRLTKKGPQPPGAFPDFNAPVSPGTVGGKIGLLGRPGGCLLGAAGLVGGAWNSTEEGGKGQNTNPGRGFLGGEHRPGGDIFERKNLRFWGPAEPVFFKKLF